MGIGMLENINLDSPILFSHYTLPVLYSQRPQIRFNVISPSHFCTANNLYVLLDFMSYLTPITIVTKFLAEQLKKLSGLKQKFSQAFDVLILPVFSLI